MVALLKLLKFFIAFVKLMRIDFNQAEFLEKKKKKKRQDHLSLACERVIINIILRYLSYKLPNLDTLLREAENKSTGI